MAEAQTYDEFVNELLRKDMLHSYNSKPKFKKMRAGDISAIINKITKEQDSIVKNEGVEFVNKTEIARTFGDNPTKFR
jgi:AAA+ superfamily predicted ATPase